MDCRSPATKGTAIITGLLGSLTERVRGISSAVKHFPLIQKKNKQQKKNTTWI